MELKYLQAAAEAFLNESLPDDWEQLEDHDQIEFIEYHTWRPLESVGAEDVLDYILDHAATIERLVEGRFADGT